MSNRLFCHIHALLEDGAQTVAAVHAGLCKGGDGAIQTLSDKGRGGAMALGLPRKLIWASLTSRHTVVANLDSGGPHWSAARLTAQHRLHRVALGLLAMESDLLVQLDGFSRQVALW